MSTSTMAVGHGDMPPVMESAREVSGWRFSCHKAPAMSSVQREKMATELGLRPAIPLPEVVFANSSLEINHLASGLTIHFDAREALHKWIEDNKGVADQWEPSAFDFTYSTSYSGTVSQEGASLKITQTSEPLPLEKLQLQVAILFYDRVLLFEDDIRDLGEIYVEVRIRVMEFGFLLLCRYYCRIDDKQTLKMLDTRYYHEFGDAFVWRDNELRESTIADIKRVLNARREDQYDAPVELSGDAVYGMLRPASTTTEKIHLVQSS
ncbi:hypothetical protein V7S43_006973 [Phytophthora oleae]|uniref:TIP41-like protein n=1 Tax=Phytophthora oleae TaxID=2107226 RepID=A0ABD3FR54_9STRA